MKVICVKFVDANNKPEKCSAWLEIGKVYDVLGINRLSDGRQSYFIVARESGDPLLSLGFYPAANFDIVSDSIPKSWIEISADGSSSIMPSPWTDPQFLQKLFDGDDGAYRLFELERVAISELD